jgi:hypothetical protein
MAVLPVITPFEVERIEIPNPPKTTGIVFEFV